MRIFGLKVGGITVLNTVLLVAFFSGCVVEERKKHDDDDCEDDSDCDDDEYCDEDNECERLASSGGSSGSSGSSGGSAGTSGSSSGGTSSTPSGSDTAWCEPRCAVLAGLCPENATEAQCITSCAMGIATARSHGCAAEYQAVIDCGADVGACDTETLEVGCTPEIEELTVCANAGT